MAAQGDLDEPKLQNAVDQSMPPSETNPDVAVDKLAESIQGMTTEAERYRKAIQKNLDQLCRAVAVEWHRYLHLGMEYLRIPQDVEEHLWELEYARGNRSYRAAVKECTEAFDFWSVFL